MEIRLQKRKRPKEIMTLLEIGEKVIHHVLIPFRKVKPDKSLLIEIVNVNHYGDRKLCVVIIKQR